MVRQFDVVAIALPCMVDDADVVHAVVFQQTEHIAIFGEIIAGNAPKVQNGERPERGAVGGRREGDVREDFARRVREGDVACFCEEVARSVRLFVVSSVAVGICRIGECPVEPSTSEQMVGG